MQPVDATAQTTAHPKSTAGTEQGQGAWNGGFSGQLLHTCKYHSKRQ